MTQWLDSLIPSGPWHQPAVHGLTFLLRSGGAVLIFLAIRWLLLRGVGVVFRPISARAARESETGAMRVLTLQGLTHSAITYTLLFLAVVTILGEAGINVTTLLAGAGVAGLALSFGAQRLVRDVLTGFFLLLEDQFRVGELVTLMGIPGIPQAQGTVTEMGLRTTRLCDPSGRVLTVSNGDIGAVLNHSRGRVLAAVEFSVPPETDPEAVTRLLDGMELDGDLFAGPPRVEGVTAIGGDRTTLRIIAEATPGKAPEAELALRSTVGRRLRDGGVEIR